jgi:hypothetical protein
MSTMDDTENQCSIHKGHHGITKAPLSREKSSFIQTTSTTAVAMTKTMTPSRPVSDHPVTMTPRTPLLPVDKNEHAIFPTTTSMSHASSKRLKQSNDDSHRPSSFINLEELSSLISSQREQIESPRGVSKDIVQFLYQQAMVSEERGDQNVLDSAGLLSLEQVLLPASATAVEMYLRNCQKVVQRHYKQQPSHATTPNTKDAWKRVRKLVFTSLPTLQQAVAESRSHRGIGDAQREVQWQHEHAQQAEQRQRDLQTARDQRRLERKRELQKKLVANQQLWREIAYLQTQLTKLHQEERMWQNAKQTLQQEQQILLQKQEEQQLSKSSIPENEDTSQILNPLAASTMTQNIMEAMEDIQLSARRIQSALQIVSQTMHTAEHVRQQLYQQYTADHQFYGYPGYHDPKALLRALSQPTTQEDDDDDDAPW